WFVVAPKWRLPWYCRRVLNRNSRSSYRQRRVSRLRFVEHVQEYGHTQACQQMNQRHQDSVRSNRSRSKRRDVTDEAQRHNHGQQNHANQGEQCCTLEAHGRDYTPTTSGVDAASAAAVGSAATGAELFTAFLTGRFVFAGVGFLGAAFCTATLGAAFLTVFLAAVAGGDRKSTRLNSSH